MSAGNTYDLGRVTVLLVEDSHYILHVMEDLLRYMSVGNVLRARDGVEAIEHLKGSATGMSGGAPSRIDLVISDLVMSPIDGLVLLKWVREGKESPNRFMPFIMMSGAADDEYVQKARDQGVNEFLAKPFSSNSVCQRVLEVIDNPRQFVATKQYFGPDRQRRQDDATLSERRVLTEKDANIIYSSDRVIRPKDPKDVFFFKLPNSLKEKAGGMGVKGRGSLPVEVLQEADAQLERKAVEFHDWALEYLANLSAYCVRAHQAPLGERRAHFDNINLLAHELRGQGGIFGYGLITVVGKSLYEITRMGCPTDDVSVDVVKAHIDTMRVVFRDKITGDGGEVGRELLKGLSAAAKRYAAERREHA